MMVPTSVSIANEHASMIECVLCIPGNEASVSSLMNKLMKAGCTVRYKEFADIHVSGHAAQEEQNGER